VPINRECPKCGEMNARVRHCRALEQMELTCLLCKYEWQLKPLDVLRADKECQAATAQETVTAQCDHSWVTSNFEAPRCLWCHVEQSAANR
jgi:hypothetical protein